MSSAFVEPYRTADNNDDTDDPLADLFGPSASADDPFERPTKRQLFRDETLSPAVICDDGADGNTSRCSPIAMPAFLAPRAPVVSVSVDVEPTPTATAAAAAAAAAGAAKGWSPSASGAATVPTHRRTSHHRRSRQTTRSGRRVAPPAGALLHGATCSCVATSSCAGELVEVLSSRRVRPHRAPTLPRECSTSWSWVGGRCG